MILYNKDFNLSYMGMKFSLICISAFIVFLLNSAENPSLHKQNAKAEISLIDDPNQDRRFLDSSFEIIFSKDGSFIKRSNLNSQNLTELAGEFNVGGQGYGMARIGPRWVFQEDKRWLVLECRPNLESESYGKMGLFLYELDLSSRNLKFIPQCRLKIDYDYSVKTGQPSSDCPDTNRTSPATKKIMEEYRKWFFQKIKLTKNECRPNP